MGLFRKIPTTQEKNDIRALISRAQTCARNLNEADKISSFFKEWDKLIHNFNRLIFYENRGVKFKISPKRDLEDAKRKKRNIERNCIDRSFADLQASLFQLKTDSGKKNRIIRFFEEMEYYSNRMESDNVAYINQLKKGALSGIETKKSAGSTKQKDTNSALFCTQCGNPLPSGAVYCGRCGFKVKVQ